MNAIDVLVPSGLAIYCIGWLGGVAVALRESTWLGILTLLVPIVWIYFMFTRIEQTIRYLVISVAGLLLILAAACIGG